MSQMPVPRIDPNGRWCQLCSRWAIGCTDTTAHSLVGWVVPGGGLQQAPPRQRSVVGTTLLVMLTVFVIAPMILFAGCQVLIGIGGAAGHR